MLAIHPNARTTPAVRAEEPMPISALQALPKDAQLQLKPLNKWGDDIDVARTQIARQVRANVDASVARRSGATGGRPAPEPAPQPPGEAHWRLPDEPDRCFGRERNTATLVAALTTGQPPKPVERFAPPWLGDKGNRVSSLFHTIIMGCYGITQNNIA